jgi:hypothetical protein
LNRTLNNQERCIYTAISSSKSKLVDRLNAALKTTNKKVGEMCIAGSQKHERREGGVPQGKNANTRCDVDELLKKTETGSKHATYTIKKQKDKKKTLTHSTRPRNQSIINRKKERNRRCMLKEENEVQKAIIDGATETRVKTIREA